MASINQDPKSKVFRIHFRYGGKQFQEEDRRWLIGRGRRG